MKRCIMELGEPCHKDFEQRFFCRKCPYKKGVKNKNIISRLLKFAKKFFLANQ